MILLVSVCAGQSQDMPAGATIERIQAITDRTMFISGEKICFSAIVYHGQDHIAQESSRVLYCELITPEGSRVSGGKYLLENSSAQGCLMIPDETISGVYYLKFYTRFMRNGSTDDYKYIMLKIINPVRTEVLPGKERPDSTLPAGPKDALTDPLLTIASEKNTFFTREEIRLDILDKTGNRLPSGLCLSIVPENTEKDVFLPGKKKRIDSAGGAFYRETRGISLTGRLMGKESGKPVGGTRVNLSIIGDRDILVALTDSAGRFFFALPDHSGTNDIFLCSEDLPGIATEILIDNDFCPRPVSLPSPVFTLSKEEMNSAFDMAVNFRINSMFSVDTTAGEAAKEKNSVSFYGNPTAVIVMEKYIELPTLREYFTELPVSVNLKTIQGRKKFRFASDQAEMSMYDPLILVDWVAVNDIEKILAISPVAIEKIELVNSLYVKGNTTYGGIISFVSKKHDFAGIDLPVSGTFVNYRFLENCTGIVAQGPFAASVPDARNTVYWNPSVMTGNDGRAVVKFTAPDSPGTYSIILRGITSAGEIIVAKKMIEINEK